MFRALLIALLVAAPPSALAKDSASAAVLDISASFAEQSEQIRKELAAGDTYSEITRQQRSDVLAALDRIDASLGNARTVADLVAQERTDLLNDQELVNTILTGVREDSRLVCRREKTVGSHRPTNTCMTIAQRRQVMEDSRETLRMGQRAYQPQE